MVGCDWTNLKLKYIYIYTVRLNVYIYICICVLTNVPTHTLVFLMMCYVCYVSMYAETDWQTGNKLNNK